MKQITAKPIKQDNTATVQIDLNNEVFQTQLFALEKPLRHAALETLAKIKQMSWQQIYQDAGLKWEKINSLPQNDAIGERYSLRLNQSRRMVARRLGNVMQLLIIPADHVASYGKK
jgi:hypothetical protein